jgi:hypothetical protein
MKMSFYQHDPAVVHQLDAIAFERLAHFGG